jgi:Protein of unknown function (DUF4058)
MPLLDHFHPPVSLRKPWESFHSRWIAAIADELNRTLPPRYSAEIQIRLGRNVEADVAEVELGFTESGPGGTADGSVAVAAATWAPPAVTATMPAVFPDSLVVEVRDTADSYRVVAVVELVSPGNKHRPENRRAFSAKSASYLQAGIGLVVVDIVSDARFNLHDEFMETLGQESARMATGNALYVAAYRPTRRDESNWIDVWAFPLGVGQPLPTVPLALRATATVPLDLEVTYSDARHHARLD